MQYINKMNLHKILFITILLGFIILLVGCNWFSLGLLNIFDPQAQIRVNYTTIDIGAGIITLEVYSLNEVEFIGWGFEYEYYDGTTKITELSKTVGATFYVEPSDTPGERGPISTIDNLPLYFKEAQDYMIANPSITEITCTITLIGTDGSEHDITIPVTVDLPALQSGEPSSITLQAAPSTVTEEDGTSTITATVKDADGSPVPDGTAVSFSSTYGTISGITTTTNGIATATLTFSADDSTSTVTATSGSVKSTVVVTYSPASVAASTITLQAAPTTVTAEEGTSLITATVTDSSGDPVPDGTGVSFSSTYGTISEITTTTNGIATATLTFSAGDSSSTVTATCGSVNTTVPVTYSPASGVPSAITLQASPVTVVVADYTSTITATITDSGGSPVPDGTAVTFSTTLGTLSSSSATTTTGIASTILTHTSAGLVSVTATSGSVSEAVVVTFQ